MRDPQLTCNDSLGLERSSTRRLGGKATNLGSYMIDRKCWRKAGGVHIKAIFRT